MATLSSLTTATGSFTPTLDDGTSPVSKSQAYNYQLGTYTKIGNRVFFDINIALSSIGSLTTSAQANINGLPIACKSEANFSVAVSVGVGQGFNITANQVPVGTVETGGSGVRMGLWDGTAGPSTLLISEISAAGGGRITLSGNYPVS